MPVNDDDLQIGDIGTKLILEVLEDSVAVDISGATTKDITLQRPDLTTVTKAAIFDVNGVDGKIYYATTITDLTMEGTYSIQAYLVIPGWTGYSTVKKLEVHGNLV